MYRCIVLKGCSLLLTRCSLVVSEGGQTVAKSLTKLLTPFRECNSEQCGVACEEMSQRGER